MKFTYCPDCGTKLIEKEIGDEGLVPYCQVCERPWFPLSYTCTITLVVNEEKEIALIRQGYVSETNYVCIAGYMKPGESGETTAAREVEEELGLKPYKISYVNSYPFEKKDMLMLGFAARVRKAEFHISQEVDKAEWFTYEEAVEKLRPGSIALQLCKEGYRLIREEEQP